METTKISFQYPKNDVRVLFQCDAGSRIGAYAPTVTGTIHQPLYW